MFGELGKRKTREREREKTIAVCHLPVDSFSLIQTLHTVAPLAQLVSISSVCVCVCGVFFSGSRRVSVTSQLAHDYMTRH